MILLGLCNRRKKWCTTHVMKKLQYVYALIYTVNCKVINPLTAKCIYICKIKNEIFIEYDSSLLAELYDKFSSILVYGK